MTFISYLILTLGAIFLSIFPFAAQIIGLMPTWLLILGLLFMYRVPLHFGIGWMFLCGMAYDLLSQNYLGLEALLFLIVGLLFRALMSHFFLSHGLGKLLLTMLFIALYEVLRVLLFALLYEQSMLYIHYEQLLSSITLGTIVLLLLHRFLPKDPHATQEH